ncbi:MAG TPA: hypothetical protein VEL77_04640 [Rugosimonospora sp.]|nr:hypothetical protein [Rugosimonospora sp.]
MARWLALIAITQQISCGGGAGQNSNVDPARAVTVSISPGSAQIAPGASVQFTVIVQNASNPAVSWQVNGVPGGNSSVGIITPSGAATASYTAPANVSGALTVTIAAVLQADATKSGSATVTINPSPRAQISISPANSSVVAGASRQFSAVVQNGPQAVIWEVDGIQAGNATFGTISSSGYYTAPATIPTPFVVTITARLETDRSIFGSASLTIVAPAPSLSISPTTANVPTGQTLQFSASVQNSRAGVIWQVNGVTDGDPTLGFGTISLSGNYMAPAIVPSPPTVTITAVLQTTPTLSASAGVTIIQSNVLSGVYSWRNDNSLTGQNGQETTLTPSTVSPTTFGKLFGCAVDGPIFAQPLYVANVAIPSQGTHNVLYAATENDSVYAFDADNLCHKLWQVSFLDSTMGVTTVPATDIPGQTDIVPEIGITGTPVIDPNTATLYVVSKTKVTANGLVVYKQELHALDLTTGWVGGIAGAEKFRGPAIIKATVSGTGDGSLAGEISFDPLKENQRSALLLAQGSVYIAFDSYDDTQPFHGWLFAFNAGDLKTPPAAFLSTPNGSNGGIGESGAAPSSDATGNVFVITSDGTFDANSGGNNYAETLLKLQMSSPSPVEDYFTPWNQATLNLTHKNFGSTGVLLLPDLAGSTTHPHLAVAGSQAGSLYLVDRYSLGGFSSTPGVDNVVQTLCFGASLTGTPAYWDSNNTPTVYVAASDDNLKAFPLAAGTFSSPSCSSGSAVPTSHSADTFPLFGASAVISSNGPAGGIIWALDTSGYATSAPAVLHAYDATNLGTELYASPSSGSGAAGIAVKFAVPTVANGKVYVGTQNELSVFGQLP